MSSEIVRPSRSMSYNDIKKRRHIRESKSKAKLKFSEASTEMVQTEKKVKPYVNSDIYDSERPNEINQIREKLSKKIYHTHLAKDTAKKSHKVSTINLTDRVISQKNNRSLFDRESEIGGLEISEESSKNVVKELIEENKSERKLLKYSELRNQFKMSKSRSKSKSAKSLINKSKLVAKNFVDIQITPEKPNINSPLKGIKNSLRIKKFESVHENLSENKPNFRYLIDTKESSELLQNKKRILVGEEDQIESSIEFQKQSLEFDEDNRLLEAMCLKPQVENIQKESKTVSISEDRFLDLLDVETSELQKYLGKKQRQKKLTNDLEKLNRKFPKGFFKF